MMDMPDYIVTLYQYCLNMVLAQLFFVCTSLIGYDNKWNNKDSKMRMHLNMDELSALNNQGWEIASHGVHHYNFLKLTDIELEYEIQQSKRTR